MQSWAQKSDEAAKEVFNIMQRMFGTGQVSGRISIPGQEHAVRAEDSKRPASKVTSKSDSCTSLSTQNSISEFGAEAEPPWLLEAMQKEVGPRRRDPLVAIKSQTRRNLYIERDAEHKVELERSRPRASTTQHGEYPVPLPQVSEQSDASSVVKKAVIESPSYPRPGARTPTQQDPSRATLAPRVTLQTPIIQVDRWPEKHVFNPAQLMQQLDTHSSNIINPPTALPTTEPAPCPPLTALLYFALELPRSSPQHRGGYMRHYDHPMRLPLSTPQQLVASTVHLRGYLTQQTTRFLSHFFSPKHDNDNNGKLQTTSDETQLVVNFPSLPCAGGYGMEQVWGPELAWAWLDASEENFADAVVGILRELAEVAVRDGRGGTVDVVCVVRKVVDGRRGYGLTMDVRRIGENLRRDDRTKTRKAAQRVRQQEDQSAEEVARAEGKMWIH
ncbi:hypothetical protein N0V93_010039 [Gnomoniopsis smithogilvyi]|uniref:Uncharacterized protein n=1 Tax=Gnomoniopsis smithogilvyi TaxID=1191159 RepID=A0A9W8YLK2_9PEZI|nr:hypothetical protein N0V93_010039 [Gnomoniopsis smithogilvyi]